MKFESTSADFKTFIGILRAYIAILEMKIRSVNCSDSSGIDLCFTLNMIIPI